MKRLVLFSSLVSVSFLVISPVFALPPVIVCPDYPEGAPQGYNQVPGDALKNWLCEDPGVAPSPEWGGVEEYSHNCDSPLVRGRSENRWKGIDSSCFAIVDHRPNSHIPPSQCTFIRAWKYVGDVYWSTEDWRWRYAVCDCFMC